MLSSARRSLLLVVLTLLPTGSALAQGSLQPPGSPAPAMKRLDQLEPRVDLATLPGNATALVVISQPGSYYLSANLVGLDGKHGILVTADDVTIDLGGFKVFGSASSLNGLEGVSASRLTVRNGTFLRWDLGLNVGAYGRIDDVFSGNNRLDGVVTALYASLSSCRSAGNARMGFSVAGGSNLSDCQAISNASAGFSLADGLAQRCIARQNPIGYRSDFRLNLSQCVATSCETGFLCANSAILRDCEASGLVSIGFQVGANSTLSGCNGGASSTFVVFNVGPGSTLTSCTASGGSTGFLTGEACTLQHCTVTFANGRGIAAGPGSIVTHCSVMDCAQIGIEVGRGGSVVSSSARRGGVGIYGAEASIIANSTATNTGNTGLQVNINSRISGSVASFSGSNGIYLDARSVLTDCNSQSNTLNGVVAISQNVIANNLITRNTQSGMVLGGDCRVEANHVYSNTGIGVQTSGTQSDIVLRNSAHNNHPGQNPSYDYFPPSSSSMGSVLSPNSSSVTAATNF